MLVFQIAMILIATKLAGDLFARFGQPSVLGKLLVGIVLGPSVLGIIHETEILKAISEIGVLLLMFMAGLETDLDEFKKSGKAGLLVGLGGIVFPLSVGTGIGFSLGLSVWPAVFLGLLLSATSVSITVQTLREMGKLDTREGTTLLSAAVIDDVVVVVLLAFVISFAGGDVNLGLVIGKKVVFFVVSILAAWKFIPWMMKRWSGLQVTEAILSAALVITFMLAYFAEMMGVAGIIGAYIAGVGIGQTTFAHQVFEKVEPVAYSIFVPVFFTSIGVTAELSGLGGTWGLAALLSVAAVLTKWVGSGLGARVAGFSWPSSSVIGAGMVSRGEVALILAAIGLEENLLSPSFFTVTVVVVLITTLLTPPLLKWTYQYKEKSLPQES